MNKADIIEWINFFENELKNDKITPDEKKETEEKLERLKKELIEKKKKESSCIAKQE